jgi:hypothetical protein
MGIDRIGKQGSTIPLNDGAGAAGSRGAERTGASFEVPKPGAAPVAEGARAGSVDPVRPALERLRSGEIDLNGYLDAKIEEATLHLGGLPPVELDAIRAALRDRMSTDPTLVELARTATGQLPPPPDE